MTVTPPVPIGAARGRAPSGRARTSPAAARSRDLLARVALTLNSSVGLKPVLEELTSLTLAATGADRCSIFLLDGERFLEPAVAVGGVPDEELWRKFRALPSLDVPDVPGLASFLAEGRAVAIPDAGICGMVPHAWVDAFMIRSAVVVPLHALGEPCGVLAVDFRSRHVAAPDEIDVLEVVASYAGLAVRNARLFDAERSRARVQSALAAAAAALSAQNEPSAIARTLAAGYAAMLDVRAGAVALRNVSRTGFTVATVDGREFAVADTDVPPALRETLASAWAGEARPVTLPEDAWVAAILGDMRRGTYLALPLGGNGAPGGAVLLALAPRSAVRAEEYAAAEALASVATAALDRGRLQHSLERQLRHARVLYELASTLPERAEANVVIRRLNELLAEDGINVTSLRVKDRRLARHLGVAGATPAREPAGDSVGVPLRVGRRVVGELTMTLDGDTDRRYLEAVARGVAEVATRGAAGAELECAARERAMVAERDRIAADLHDSVGQLFVGIGLLAQRSADELPSDSPWGERFVRLAEVSREGKWVIDDAVRALAFVPTGRRGLVETLRALARSVAADSGLSVVVTSDGRPRRLGVDAEQALYRVAHQAVANAWRHARCTTIVVEVVYEGDAVTVSVRDDGTGLVQRESSDARTGFGMTSMRRGVAAVGGTIRVANRAPRGVVVEARVPLGAR